MDAVPACLQFMNDELRACRTGGVDEVKAAVRLFRQAYLQGGPPLPALADALHACVDGLTPGRGDAALCLEMFLFDVLMFIPAGLRRPAGPAADYVSAIQSAAPKLLELRKDSDILVATWAWHLLSWLPTPVPGLAAEALVELSNAPRAFQQITFALTAASTAEGRAEVTQVLESWLPAGGDKARAAAIVLAQLHGSPTKPQSVSEPTYQTLLALSEADRWAEWEAAPAREFGFFADLALCLQRAGYHRATGTLPALLRIVRVCSPQEIDHVASVFVKVLFHSHPWPENAELALLDEAQRAALQSLVLIPRVWLPRPAFYQLLKEYGLPLGSGPTATLLGIEPPADAVTIKSVQDGVVTLDTDKTPHEIVQALKNS